MRIPRPRALATCLAATVAMLFLASPSLALAADAKPKKKDSAKFLQPKEVTYTTKVEPAKAKPGETVTYTVTAKIDMPWHIYAYVDEQPAEGPRGTQFDFFDTAGLTPAKSWASSEPPHEIADAQFGGIKVQYHEDEVSWSTTLKVPADAKPGKKTLRNQIYFQICNPKS